MSAALPTPDIPEASSEIEEDWEEWDGRSPFWIHCVAGSLAGVSEVSSDCVVLQVDDNYCTTKMRIIVLLTVYHCSTRLFILSIQYEHIFKFAHLV